jgi:hypothetical protein
MLFKPSVALYFTVIDSCPGALATSTDAGVIFPDRMTGISFLPGSGLPAASHPRRSAAARSVIASLFRTIAPDEAEKPDEDLE